LALSVRKMAFHERVQEMRRKIWVEGTMNWDGPEFESENKHGVIQ
jgi:hypothetical protein